LSRERAARPLTAVVRESEFEERALHVGRQLPVQDVAVPDEEDASASDFVREDDPERRAFPGVGLTLTRLGGI
jgi:hypothetical protein